MKTRHARRCLASASLMLTLCVSAPAGAGQPAAISPLSGYLEHGQNFSRLYRISPESGDLIVYVVSNTSQAGREILSNCLSGMPCAALSARIRDLDGDALVHLRIEWEAGASAMLLVDQAQGVSVQRDLPFYETRIETRFGWLSVNDDQMLLFNGIPVVETTPVTDRAKSTSPQMQDGLWARIRQRLRDPLQRLGLPYGEKPEIPSDGIRVAPREAASHAPQGTAKIVQGNAALHMVASFESAGGSDVVLLESTGGAACPALYRVATVMAGGIAVTPEFGNCSDLVSIGIDHPDEQAVLIKMVGLSEPEMGRSQSRLQKIVFRFRDGVVTQLPTPEVLPTTK